MDTPVFLFGGDNKEFAAKVKSDIIATIEFLFKRGMWSKLHYELWLKEAQKMNDAEKLHLWWDAITTGAMFEVESPVGEMFEGMEEAYEEKGEEMVNGPEDECPNKKMKQMKMQKMQNKKLNF